MSDKTVTLSADPRDNEPLIPKWVPRSDPTVAAYWIAKLRAQLTYHDGETP